jgi:autotransporter-associated beta strand protein
VNNTIAGGAYTFSGSGKLSGATNLVKQGTGTLILANSGGNDYTGTTTINGGTLQVGDGVTLFAGQLGSGSIAIGAAGTLALNRPLLDDYTLANIISGTGGILQQGGNTITLTGNNLAYDGTITVSSGVIRASSANALGTATGGVIISGTGALELTGQTVADAVQLTGGGTLRAFSGTTNIVSSVITLSSGGVLDGLNSTTLTVNTAITGTGGLTKAGNGLAILTADSTYTGGTTISGGTLQIGATAGTGTTGSLPAGDIAFNPSSGTATLTILRGDSTLNISNNITSSGAGTNAIVIGNASGSSGIVTFSGSNTFTGNVTITGGALKITNSSALGAGAKTVSIGNASRPALLLDGSGSDLTLASGIGYAISSDGGVVNTTSNPGAIVNVAGNNVINGNIALVNGGGGNGKILSQAGTITINGNIDSTGATGVRALLIGGASNGTINGLIADASFVTSLTKDGSGTWTLNGTNTFTGAVNVSAGTLRVNAVAASGIAQPLGQGTAVVTLGNATTSGTLEYSGNADATFGRGITVGGGAGGLVKNSGSGLLTLSGTITRASRPFTFQGGAFNVTGQITGAASTLDVAGANVTLSQTTNNYVGATNVYGGGVLKNGATSALPSGTTITLGESATNTGGIYDLNGFDATVTGVTDAGTGTRKITNSAASGTSTLFVTGSLTYGGTIQDGPTGKVALTKSGTGTYTLTGVNSNTGDTTVTGGTLDLTSPALIASNAIAKVGGALSIGGTVNGNVTIETGGSLYAGGTSRTGVSAINGSLVLNNASDVFFDLGGTTRGAAVSGYDAINGLTQLTLAGTLHVGFASGFTAAESDVFNLIDWASLSGNVTDNGFTFDFGSAPPGSNLQWDTANFLNTGTISLISAAAPEPGRAMLLVVGLVAMISRRRRQDRTLPTTTKP